MGEEKELNIWCDPFDPCGYLVIIIIYVFMMAFWLNDKRINHKHTPYVLYLAACVGRLRRSSGRLSRTAAHLPFSATVARGCHSHRACSDTFDRGQDP